MIDYKSFRFACPPLTGASWFIKLAQLSGFGPGFRNHAFEPFKNGHEIIRLSIISNPYDWLYRIYDYHIKGGNFSKPIYPYWHLDNKSFQDFCQHYLVSDLSITKTFSRYEADVIIRLEDMPWCAIEFFESLGVSKSILDNVTKLDMAFYYSKNPKNPEADKLRRSIIKKEEDFCDKYDYY